MEKTTHRSLIDRGWGHCVYDERTILSQVGIDTLEGLADVAPVWAIHILRHWRPPRPKFTDPVPWLLLRRANEDEDFRHAVLAAIRLGVGKAELETWPYE